MALPTARAAIELACKPFDPQTIRAARIRDTAHLEYLQVSPALVPEVKANDRLEIVEERYPLVFDETGEVTPLPDMMARGERSEPSLAVSTPLEV
jgi:hypothetical protein